MSNSMAWIKNKHQCKAIVTMLTTQANKAAVKGKWSIVFKSLRQRGEAYSIAFERGWNVCCPIDTVSAQARELERNMNGVA